jgi:hypothetical protein
LKTRIPSLQEIQELVAFLPLLLDEGFAPVRKWHGGEKDQDGVITMPYPEYQPVVNDFFRVASDECWIDYDYLSKSAGQMLDDEDSVKTADLDQIKTMLTFCARGERFCTGHWGAVIENGLVCRLLQRLAVLGQQTE